MLESERRTGQFWSRQTDRVFVTEVSEGLDVCFMDEKMLL